ncbi:hypothetical protein OsJ_07879 [Oryza sativa Japonica Group]|uniref:Uncharacterized protein n=1 Tax=Oryza sativa subsp. japonica TaxID=39947 RepID=B9F1K6_ORYSJ|nr:hypothetical protein OsJ_07879 [Oryza sativa Japonica Group]BAD28152.1 unknown protein [Oryza sativa Japonica Group]BAD28318.1 unknown protein [Oryza sativa Japonica Group]
MLPHPSIRPEDVPSIEAPCSRARAWRRLMAPHAPVSSRAGCHRREIAGAPPRLTPAVSEPPAAVPDRAGHAGCAEPRLCLAR